MFDDLLKRALGKAGRAVDVVGNRLGNPLPDWGLTQRAESVGSQALSTPQRINTSLQNTGGIAEGDYATAAGMGLPYSPSRADGGILTSQQQTQNSDAVSRYLASQGITNPNDLNPAQKTDLARIQAEAGGGGTGAGGDSGQSAFEAALARARDAARQTAEAGYNRARGLYDEGMGLLGQRRKQFDEQFAQGNEDILQGYEGERGNLQRSAEDAGTRLAKSLRALGLGGSAFERASGRQIQNQQRQLGNLGAEKMSNERANKSQYEEKGLWANQQEGALRRGLEDAGNVRSSAESSADIGYLSDIGNLFNTILSNQLALKASTQDYQSNPYVANISSFLNSLNGGVPQIGGGGGTTEQGVNLREQDPTLALLRNRRQGVQGAGLYA